MRKIIVALLMFGLFFVLTGCDFDWQSILDELNGKKSYNIEYVLNGGTIDENIPTTYRENDLPLTLPIPTKEGHIFIGWFNNIDFEGEAIIEIAQGTKENLTFYAKFERVYTITYYVNEGTLPEDAIITYTKDDLPIVLPIPSREGYTFDGWYRDSEYSFKLTQINNPNDITLYAKWVEIEKVYIITYILNGGTNHPNNPTTYTENQLPIAISMPTREGYIFMGWYLTPDFSGEKITDLSKETTGDIVIYAKWELVGLETTVYLVEIAEHSRLQSDYDLAKNAIEALPDDPQKEELLERLLQIEIIEDDVIRDDSTIID